MTTPIQTPASRVRQGDLTLYTTSLTVRELIRPGFFSVETLDPEDASDTGYQRLLNKARAKKLAGYVLKGQDSNDAFLPTSILLATDKTLEYNNENHMLTIDSTDVGPFSVVDGQHRLEGLRMAAEKDPRVIDFEVPVNIAGDLPRIHQMCHFLIVNTTQKSVDKSVEQRIIARLTQALQVEDMPSLPKWIQNIVESGEVEKALKLVDFLNEEPTSPWRGRVKMANERHQKKSGKTMNQRSLVKALVKYVLTASNPLETFRDIEKEKRVLLNYWKAVAGILDDGQSVVLFKYNGVELFSRFSTPFFNKLLTESDFTEGRMQKLLQQCFDAMEGEYAGVGHPEYWHKGNKASFLNAGAVNQIAQEMARALNRSAMGEVQL